MRYFVIDPTTGDFSAMDCYRIDGDNTRAAEYAHEVPPTRAGAADITSV